MLKNDLKFHFEDMHANIKNFEEFLLEELD